MLSSGYEKNVFGDVVAVYDEAGTKLISYKYDAYGKCTSSQTNGGYSTAAYNNPFGYRGYYYDRDLELYYLNSRYYDGYTGRFISADNIDVVWSTPNALTDKNLYSYCDNNPVMRRDDGGAFWDTVFDVVSLAFSVADVIATPANPWAWAGLVGDVVDLIPGVSGTGEMAKSLGAARKAANLVENTADIKDTQKAIEAMAEIAEAAEDGYKTFKTAKKHLEVVDSNIEWHHFVEQSQIARSGFSKVSINNSSNLVGIDKALHRRISGFYSGKPDFVKKAGKSSVREWISDFNYQQQYTFGVFIYQLMKYM